MDPFDDRRFIDEEYGHSERIIAYAAFLFGGFVMGIIAAWLIQVVTK